jgi:hypothetical protein
MKTRITEPIGVNLTIPPTPRPAPHRKSAQAVAECGVTMAEAGEIIGRRLAGLADPSRAAA